MALKIEVVNPTKVVSTTRKMLKVVDDQQIAAHPLGRQERQSGEQGDPGRQHVDERTGAIVRHKGEHRNGERRGGQDDVDEGRSMLPPLAAEAVERADVDGVETFTDAEHETRRTR